jgi:hypothetical protein
LFNALAQQKTLKKLSLSEIKPKAKTEAIRDFATYLARNNILEELELTYLGLPPSIFLQILESVCKNTSLKYINLAGNQFVDRNLALFKSVPKTQW